MNVGSPYAFGLGVTLAGVLILSPASLLIRLADTDPWTVVLYQSGLMAVVLLGILVFRSGLRALIPDSLGLAAAAFFAADNILFTTAITYTSVANTLVILAAAPFFAILGSRLLFREPSSKRTWFAVTTAMVGIAIVFSRSFAAGRLIGDLSAVGAAIGIAGTLVVLRSRKSAGRLQAAGLGGLFAAVLSSIFSSPLDLSGQQLSYLMILGLLVLPISFVLIFLGPKYLSAPEVSLIMLVETVLGPVWVWLESGETPALEAVLGGGVVLSAIVIHSVMTLREPAQSTPTPS